MAESSTIYQSGNLIRSSENCLCFTGHRMITDFDRAALNVLLNSALYDAYNMGIRTFLSGGALGFDTLAAEAVLRLRSQLPDVNLFLALPCRSQADRWSSSDRRTYRSLLENANQVFYVSDDYFEGCMQKRNRFLVDHAAYCICFLRFCRGGTWYTVSYAYDQGIKIRNLALEIR
ncbi:MAG: DUF1273 family protein [Clostridia bacterium]|nr:DUF1273 family protein [Clostridia bacterium]